MVVAVGGYDPIMRSIIASFVVAPPAGARVRTRIRPSKQDTAVLHLVGAYLGGLASGDLACRCAMGPGADGRTGRKRALTVASSSRWAGAITRTSNDQWQRGYRNLLVARTNLRRAIRVIDRRLAVPVGQRRGRADGEAAKPLGNETIRVHPEQGWVELKLPAPLAYLANRPHGRYRLSCPVQFIEGVRDARSDGDSVRPAARVQERTSGSEDVPDAVRQLRRACMARQRRAGASPTPLRRRVPAWTPFPRAARACLAAPSSVSEISLSSSTASCWRSSGQRARSGRVWASSSAMKRCASRSPSAVSVTTVTRPSSSPMRRLTRPRAAARSTRWLTFERSQRSAWASSPTAAGAIAAHSSSACCAVRPRVRLVWRKASSSATRSRPSACGTVSAGWWRGPVSLMARG